MIAIEFGAHEYREFLASKGFCRVFGIGAGAEEVAAKGHIELNLAFVHGLQAADGVVSVFRGWCEIELLTEVGHEFVAHLLPYAHRAIALHVAVATHGANSGALSADLALQQMR